MFQRFGYYFLLIFLIAAGCRNDAAQKGAASSESEKSQSSNKMEFKCTLSPESLLGFNLGDTIDLIAKRKRFTLATQKIKTGDSMSDIFIYNTPNNEALRIYPVKKGGATVVQRLEYAGTLCQTDKGVGVTSTISALLKAYPNLEIHGSASDGRTLATGGGWSFLLGTQIFTQKVDIPTINQDIRVTAVVMQ